MCTDFYRSVQRHWNLSKRSIWCTSQSSVDAVMRHMRLHLTTHTDRAQTWKGWRHARRNGSQRVPRKLSGAPGGLRNAPPQQLGLGGALWGGGRPTLPALPASRARLGLHLLDVSVQGCQLPMQLPELACLLRPAQHAQPTSQTEGCEVSVYAGVANSGVRTCPGTCDRNMHTVRAASGNEVNCYIAASTTHTLRSSRLATGQPVSCCKAS